MFPTPSVATPSGLLNCPSPVPKLPPLSDEGACIRELLDPVVGVLNGEDVPARIDSDPAKRPSGYNIYKS